ncbi:MAG TPA: choice-of-anchor D domain-containing protein [Candidatus Saccharicenans sp.]|jgi:M6 family metalloprotease-like protein|nr:choice-of-anchor D domain-containing protein [Candidatus Saccharicenans sp.]HQO76212.1 choice-of-anchor D domain-containing protein [Candidatus Saccharicenans sp.]HUM78843.1 choice-of-anchor D domain-containing protein [Candidatus Saccharicenans sp.]
MSKKSCLSGFFILILTLFAKSAFAMDPPTKEQINKYFQDGSYAARVAAAKAIGNYKVAQDLVAQMQYRINIIQQQMNGQSTLGRTIVQAPPIGTRHRLPSKGTVKVFALVFDFLDYPLKTDLEVIRQKLFGAENPADSTYPYESLRAYYLRSSYSQLDIQGDVFYYQSSVNRDAIATMDKYANENSIERENLVKEALNHFASSGHDFSQYDNDGDGYIDYFLIFWTGPRGEWASFWWSYQPTFSDDAYMVSGKKLYRYSWQWELDNYTNAEFSPISAIHNTGHALGLPDYYDYDVRDKLMGGVGGFDMMDSRNFDHNCFSKFLLEWLTPDFFNSGSKSITLRTSGNYPDAFMFTPAFSTDPPFDQLFSEYFMVQNRQATGNDAKLSAINNGDVGLAIWHVNSVLNSLGTDFLNNNTESGNKLLRLIQADGLDEIEQYGSWFDAEDFYRVGKEFGPETTPATNFDSGDPTHISITEILTPDYGQTYTFLASCLTPKIRLPLTALDFGSVSVGTSVDKSCSLYNDGQGDLIIYDIYYESGSSNFHFISPTVPFSISPGSSKDITFEYTPNDTAAATAFFRIETNDPDHRRVSLELRANTQTGPIIIVSPINLDFGEVLTNQSKDMDVTISNDGQIDLTISNITQIAGSGDFSYTGAANFTLKPSDSRTLIFRFQPTKEGQRSATFRIDSNSINYPQLIIEVKGTGAVRPVLALNAYELDFGDVNLCSQLDKSLTVTNNGNTNLIVSNIARTSGSADFSFRSPALPAAIAAGATINITFGFSPSVLGEATAVFNITSNDPNSPEVAIQFKGTSVQGPKIVLSAGSLNFGEVNVSTSKDLAITVSNEGKSSLIINNITQTSGSSDFSFTGPSIPINILPDGTSTLTFRFKPVKEGPQSAIFVINSNDPCTPDVSLTLSGIGLVAPRIRLGTTTVDFGNINLCTSGDKTLVIYNDGNAPLIINNIARTSGSADFSLNGVSFPTTIPATSSKEITIRFSPHSKANLSAIMTVTSNDPLTPAVNFNVSGKGFVPNIAISVTNEKKIERSWIISRGYSIVTIEVTKSAPFNVAEYRLYRREQGSASQVLVKTLYEPEFIAGRATYIDKFLTANKSYTYSVEAVDCTGQTITTSGSTNLAIRDEFQVKAKTLKQRLGKGEK